ncbi:hypothetical protein LCGC14_1937890 [marine sediment metagenome]|uniref:Uncharacterized protein n=1 Tax=marine sediment metagenome TaxID=412755 RepID=A0A0F9FL34_9ZZZZ
MRRRAEVVERLGGTTVVDDEKGLRHFLRGLNKTSASVGTKGWIEYRSTPSLGLWYFEQPKEGD